MRIVILQTNWIPYTWTTNENNCQWTKDLYQKRVEEALVNIVFHSGEPSVTQWGWIARSAWWVLNPVVLFNLSQSLQRHRKLAGMSPDRLVNKTLTFATGTSCGTPMNGPERLHAVSAGLCQSGLCSQQPHFSCYRKCGHRCGEMSSSAEYRW